jgi:hypothetical protein
MASLQFLEILLGYLLCAILGLFGLLLIWKIATNQIDLTHLLSDDDGMASTSRFQLIIFIFVVALSFFLVVVSNVKIRQYGGGSSTEGLPDVPGGVLALLGISASSYLVSRGISASQDDGISHPKGNPPPNPPSTEPPPRA